jgi:hypothetical protein
MSMRPRFPEETQLNTTPRFLTYSVHFDEHSSTPGLFPLRQFLFENSGASPF